MFVDARTLATTTLRAMVCVIGAGVAGIAMARELERAGIDTVVLESGAFVADPATRDLYRGDTAGLPFAWEDGARSRFFGGSSNCWGGWCAPLHPHEMAPRPWIADSGWPISRADLDAHYRRAQEVLDLGPYDYDVDRWVRRIAHPDVIRFRGDRVGDVLAHMSFEPKVGRLYRDELRAARHVRVVLRANAVEVETDATSRAVTGVRVRTLTGGAFTVTANDYVLATGGIENARLLLASDRVEPHGLGNQHDLVGRYFADHPRVMVGDVHLAPDWQRNRLYDIKRHYRDRIMSADGAFVGAQFMVAPEVQRAEGLTSALMWFSTQFHGEGTDAAEAIIRMKHRAMRKADPNVRLRRDLATVGRHPVDAASFFAARVVRPRPLIRRVRIEVIVEPTPERDSRVTLSDRRDALGMRRACVDWRVSDSVKRTIDCSVQLLAEELQAAGVAAVDSSPSIAETGWPPKPGSAANHLGTWHHMGTTRMHDDPTRGVVDRDCRVHGMPNLFVAGSSVFPTYGADFPTMTLTALALRLADHLVDRTRRVEAAVR